MTVLILQALGLLLASYLAGCVLGCMARRAVPPMPGGGPPSALGADGEPSPISSP